MALPEFTMRQLLEAGVHFGHQTQRWNPRMGEFIYGARNGIHIMDLTQTVPMLDAALNAIRECVAKNGRILFVGTKRQAAQPVAEAAEKCAQYYMNHRWLGGTLTNWQTVSKSIQRLKQIDEILEAGGEGLTKKERLGIERDQTKLQASLGGIREMGGVPDMLFVIDVKKEALAVAEANKLGIPVVAVVDTNCSPDGIDYIIPGNDDAARAIALYCDLVSRAALDGMTAQMGAAGVDLGAMEDAPWKRQSPRPKPPKAETCHETDTGAGLSRPRDISNLRRAEMAITAAMVKELRDTTGAGMMDAKKALTENDGDMQAAVDWLRTKGLAKAAKKSGRTAAEGSSPSRSRVARVSPSKSTPRPISLPRTPTSRAWSRRSPGPRSVPMTSMR